MRSRSTRRRCLDMFMTSKTTAIANTKNTVNAPTPGDISSCSGVKANVAALVMDHSSILQIGHLQASRFPRENRQVPRFRMAILVSRGRGAPRRRTHRGQFGWRVLAARRHAGGKTQRIPRGWLRVGAGVHPHGASNHNRATLIRGRAWLDAVL